MNTRLAPPPPGSASDADRQALDARLAALAARRPAAARPPQPATPRAGAPAAAAPRGKRRHPAKGARAATLGMSLASTGALAAFFAVSNAGSGNQVQAATIVTASPASPAPTSAAATVAPAATIDLIVPDPGATAAPAAAPTTAPVTAATDPVPVAAAPVAPGGDVTIVQGGVFHNKWGDVQVQATFAVDGALVDVVTLETPSRDGKSVRINDRAVPVLNDEALSAQSAAVDTVSGATYTSDDYRRSLQSAIDVANAAGLTTLV